MEIEKKNIATVATQNPMSMSLSLRVPTTALDRHDEDELDSGSWKSMPSVPVVETVSTR